MTGCVKPRPLRLRVKLRVRGMTIFRLTDGKIIEEWTSFDQYALLTQLGLIPE